MLHEKNKCHVAAAFHNVYKYCFLIKRSCESQQPTRVSKTFREINNMLVFSSLQRVTHNPREKKSSIFTFLFLVENKGR